MYDIGHVTDINCIGCHSLITFSQQNSSETFFQITGIGHEAGLRLIPERFLTHSSRFVGLPSADHCRLVSNLAIENLFLKNLVLEMLTFL